MPVHYGLINWILGKDPMFKPNTRFMLSYLAGVGAIASVIRDIDLELLWKSASKKYLTADPSLAKVLNRKLTLITRPIRLLLDSPHVLAGFIGYHEGHSWKTQNGKIEFTKNPLELLSDLYSYLDLEENPQKPACDQIWDHDAVILKEGLSFYADLEKITGLKKDFAFWNDALNKDQNPDSSKISTEVWKKCVAAHKNYQVGLDLLKIIGGISLKSKFNEIGIDTELNGVVPAEFTQTDKVNQYVKALNPPPQAKSDEVVAPMGGMFYSKEAPNLPPLVQEGESFKAGQPLFVIEVMKMFNKISAPFSGTIVKNLLKDSDGKIVTKGQTIFQVKPDEVLKVESPQEIEARKKSVTEELLSY